MAEGNQFLRVTLEDTAYLLPSEASISIEQRDHLSPDAAGGIVTAWRSVRSDRWPAFYLGGDLRPARGTRWQRAVFLDRRPHPLGLIVDEVQLLPRAEVHIEPLHVLGPSPFNVGPLFSGAWMREPEMILVLDPRGLVAYLDRLWNN